MDEVADLLRIWELPELIPIFLQNEITLQALSALTTDVIGDLIPKIGPRALFLRCWRGWQTEFSSTNVTLSILNLDNDVAVLSENENLTLRKCNNQLGLDEDDDVILQSANANLSLVGYSNQDLPIYLGPCTTKDPEQEKKQPSPRQSPVIDSPECRALEKLLKETLETSILLTCKGGAIDGDSARNLLVSAIAKQILRLHNDHTIRGEIYFRWANAIKALFPGENTTTYYVPACTTANGITLPARGKLVYQVLNQRKRLQKLGALPTKKRNIVDSSQPSSSRTSPRPPPSLLDDGIYPNETLDDLNWLRNSSDPWSIVLVKWKATVKERIRKLHDDNEQSAQTIESYFEEFPALKKPHGYVLLSTDFDVAYGQYSDSLFINYPITKNVLLKVLSKRKKEKDRLSAEILELSQLGDEENVNLAGFLSIPHLLSFPASTFGQNKKRAKTEKINRWKPSKCEARDSFITHIKADIEIKDAIATRYEVLRNRGCSSQPFIIIVGEELRNITNYLVVANQNVIYERSNILQAVDTCYKIFWSLNAVYSVESYPIWYFIQRGLYKMSSKWDKGSTSVESLLTDCNL